MQKPYATYKGDEFRKLIRQYSNQRMEFDVPYRKQVHAALAQRRTEQKNQKAATA